MSGQERVLNRESMAVQVAAILRDEIMAGELPPGTPLRETPLASRFGVSRNTVREALGLLTGDGIVVHHPFKGAAVVELTATDVVEMFQLRRFLETAAIDAGDFSAEKLDLLRSRVAALEMLPAESDWREVVQADLDFHQALVRSLGNSRFNRVFDSIITELRLLILIANSEDGETPASLARQHGELVDLLVAGNRARCKRRLVGHLNDAERLFLEYMRRLPGAPRQAPSA